MRLRRFVSLFFVMHSFAYATTFDLNHIRNQIEESQKEYPLTQALQEEFEYLKNLAADDVTIETTPKGLKVKCKNKRACQAFINLMRRPVVEMDWHYLHDGGASARPYNYEEQQRIRSGKNIAFLLSGGRTHGKSSLANFAMFLSTVTGLETLPQAIEERIARGENIFTADDIRAEHFNTRGQVALGTDWANRLFSPAKLLEGLRNLYQKPHMREQSRIEAMPALYATRISIEGNSYLKEEPGANQLGDAADRDIYATSIFGSYFNTRDGFTSLGEGERRWNVTMLDTSGTSRPPIASLERPDDTVLDPNLDLGPKIKKLMLQADTLEKIGTALKHHRDVTRAANTADSYNGKVLVIRADKLLTDQGRKEIKERFSFLHEYKVAAHLFVAITHAEVLERRNRDTTKELLTQCGLGHIGVEKIFFFDFMDVYSLDNKDPYKRSNPIHKVNPRSGDFSIVEEGGSHHELFRNFAEKRKLTILKNMASLTALFKALFINAGDRLTLDGTIESIEEVKNRSTQAIDRVRIPSQIAIECANLIRAIRSGNTPQIAAATCNCVVHRNITSRYNTKEAEISTLLNQVNELQRVVQSAMNKIWKGEHSDTNLNEIRDRLTEISNTINIKRQELTNIYEERTRHNCENGSQPTSDSKESGSGCTVS